jgi:hypothetical protein
MIIAPATAAGGVSQLAPARRDAVVGAGGEDGVERTAGLAGKGVAAHTVVGFGMADERLNCRAAPLGWWRRPSLLDGRVDDRLGKVGRLGCSRPGRGRKALRQQGDELFLAGPLAPAGHRGPVERALMSEEVLAAKQLISGS